MKNIKNIQIHNKLYISKIWVTILKKYRSQNSKLVCIIQIDRLNNTENETNIKIQVNEDNAIYNFNDILMLILVFYFLNNLLRK